MSDNMQPTDEVLDDELLDAVDTEELEDVEEFDPFEGMSDEELDSLCDEDDGPMGFGDVEPGFRSGFVALVGRPNAGKSTLLNALTDAGVLAANKLFATLDVTSRAIELPDGRSVLLADTVGLIRRLPHNLVEAFKSTLEEAANADIILNIIDISSDDAYGQAQVTEELLNELGCEGIPRINVLNKCDKLAGWENIPEDDNTVKISAKEKIGFDRLLECIAANLPETSVRGSFVIPYDKGNLLNVIRDEGKIFSEEYTAEGTLIDALVDNKVYYLVEKYKQ